MKNVKIRQGRKSRLYLRSTSHVFASSRDDNNVMLEHIQGNADKLLHGSTRDKDVHVKNFTNSCLEHLLHATCETPEVMSLPSILAMLEIYLLFINTTQ